MALTDSTKNAISIALADNKASLDLINQVEAGAEDVLALKKDQNLADLQSASQARTNLGLGSTNSPTFAGLTLDFGTHQAQITGAFDASILVKVLNGQGAFLNMISPNDDGTQTTGFGVARRSGGAAVEYANFTFRSEQDVFSIDTSTFGSGVKKAIQINAADNFPTAGAVTAQVDVRTDGKVGMNRGIVVWGALTTAQRDAIPSLTNGTIIYNSDTNKFQGRAGGVWVDLH